MNLQVYTWRKPGVPSVCLRKGRTVMLYKVLELSPRMRASVLLTVWLVGLVPPATCIL